MNMTPLKWFIFALLSLLIVAVTLRLVKRVVDVDTLEGWFAGVVITAAAAMITSTLLALIWRVQV